MPMRSRIPVRKAVPGVTDENKVGTVAGRMIKDGGEPAVAGSKLHSSTLAVSAIPSAAGVVGGPGAGVSKAFGAAAQRAAVPAKVFGSQVSRIAAAAAGARPRSAFGEVANTKVVKAAVGRLTKPEEVAAMINGKQMVRGGRVALSGTGVGTVAGGGAVKQGLPLARSRLGTVTARPTGVAAAAAASRSTTAILGNRPISKPSAAFGARRPVAVKSTAVSVVSAAGANAVAANASKRARSAAAPVVDAPSSVLGKHTRSGRLPVRASSVDSVETTSTLAMSSERSYQEAGVVYDSTAATSVETSPTVESTGFGDDKLDDDRKFVDMDAIDYALAHSGLLGEVAISMDEINEFEADVNPIDTTLVPEFSDDIFGYMRDMEQRLMPNAKYMALQPALTWSTRSILIEWVVQVHERFDLLPESLYLAVNFIDRFLSVKEIAISKLQLVGAVCLLLATKYEEIHVPSVKDIEYMVEGNYKVPEILAAERFVLRMLNFDLGWPGPLSFLRRISKADAYDPQTRTLAKYLMEVTLMDERFIGVPCSKIAAIAHCLAMRYLDKGPWTRAHAFYSGYFESELLPHVAVLVRLLMEPVKHRAIYEKYTTRQYMRASEFVLKWFTLNDVQYLLVPTNGDHVPESTPLGDDYLELPPF
ncbi:mitochondrial aspartate-glutamate transporter agc1 [Coemansia sp. S3946]|nr:mitochondrial aspartate-glutamate transporter agc1 [Coemansia sp. S3946]